MRLPQLLLQLLEVMRLILEQWLLMFHQLPNRLYSRFLLQIWRLFSSLPIDAALFLSKPLSVAAAWLFLLHCLPMQCILGKNGNLPPPWSGSWEWPHYSNGAQWISFSYKFIHIQRWQDNRHIDGSRSQVWGWHCFDFSDYIVKGNNSNPTWMRWKSWPWAKKRRHCDSKTQWNTCTVQLRWDHKTVLMEHRSNHEVSTLLFSLLVLLLIGTSSLLRQLSFLPLICNYTLHRATVQIISNCGGGAQES